MKLKFILPFYFVLASITFCSRQISDPGNSKNTLLNANSTAIVTPDKVTGSLELDPATNTIYADLWLQVSSVNFKYAHDFMPLQSDNNYKGIAFRYYDTINNAPDNGIDTTQIHVVFNFTNDNGWKVDEEVRVMSLDEDEQKAFEELKPYFIKRMDYFAMKPCTYQDLLMFNEEWNTDNPGNPVTTAKDGASEEKKRKSEKHQKLIPRLTKDDGILLLKLKK